MKGEINMINTGLDKGVMQVSDLIDKLKSIQEEHGNFKVSMNGTYCYKLQKDIEIDRVRGYVDLTHNLHREEDED